ncbi:MAG TPA: tetratricopeptide repeat protein [Limnobacter sp.]|uniref:YfgM family protein n=1 Tax=Limnobacter sp. TaxID=2003368 RepID=UPI002ED92B41
MSRYTLEEEEQIANFKAFWNKYGNFILTVLILVFGSFAANNGWKWWQARESAAAVAPYEKLEKALADGDLALASQIQNTLSADHSRSPYAQRGALLVARALYAKGQSNEAKTQLEWAVEHARQDEFTATASLMLSGLLLDDKQYDKAAALLEKSYPGFEGLFHDRKGDIALARGDAAKAKAEYDEALKTIQADSPWKPVIERKLAALPKTGDKAQ